MDSINGEHFELMMALLEDEELMDIAYDEEIDNNVKISEVSHFL